jgi:hypothetical protein
LRRWPKYKHKILLVQQGKANNSNNNSDSVDVSLTNRKRNSSAIEDGLSNNNDRQWTETSDLEMLEFIDEM